MLLDQLGCDADDMLPLPVLDHVQRLQCTDDVILRDACHLTAPGSGGKAMGRGVKNKARSSTGNFNWEVI